MDIGQVAGSEASELLCYQLAREAMSNAAKHSKASRICVTLSAVDATLDLTVADDGVGFDPEAVDSLNHFGLSLIAERVKAANGIVEVRSSIGSGTTVHAEIPSFTNEETPD